MSRHRRAVGCVIALVCSGCAAWAPKPTPPVLTVKIVALNDFHGNLLSPGTFAYASGEPAVVAGGADYLAAYVAQRISVNPRHVVVGAGDLIGASQLLSAASHDEAAIEAMNLLGLDVAAVGNHEFDAGVRELKRKQAGGCLAGDAYSCLEGGAFPGARFRYLSANVIEAGTGKPLFPPYEIRTFGAVRVAFIGLVLQGAPSIVLPSAVAGLTFRDEADTVNALVPELRRQGANAIVVLLHQGAVPDGPVPRGTTINDCPGMSGPGVNSELTRLVSRLDDAVDLVVSAHTHMAYNCRMTNAAGRSIAVTQAGAFGRVITDIDLNFEPQSKKVVAVTATNVLVSQPDADRDSSPVHPYLSSTTVRAIRSLVADYRTALAPVANQRLGAIAAPLPSTPDGSGSGESLAGDLVADSQLAVTSPSTRGGAVLALVNGSGVRNPGFDLPGAAYPRDVTYQEAFNVRSFGNTLVTLTLTAQQLRDVLEQQFRNCLGQTEDNLLELSAGLHVEWSAGAPPCHRVVNVALQTRGASGAPAWIVRDGVVLHPEQTFRVSVDNYLAFGGSHFSVLTQGTGAQEGPRDIDAIVEFMQSWHGSGQSPYDPRDPALGIPRITRLK